MIIDIVMLLQLEADYNQEGEVQIFIQIMNMQEVDLVLLFLNIKLGKNTLLVPYINHLNFLNLVLGLKLEVMALMHMLLMVMDMEMVTVAIIKIITTLIVIILFIENMGFLLSSFDLF